MRAAGQSLSAVFLARIIIDKKNIFPQYRSGYSRQVILMHAVVLSAAKQSNIFSQTTRS